MSAKLILESCCIGFMFIFQALSLRYYHCDSAPIRLGQRSRAFIRFVNGSLSAPHIDYVVGDGIPPDFFCGLLNEVERMAR